MKQKFDEKKFCEKCKRLLLKKQNMFYTKSAGMLPGLVCEPCNVLYESAEWMQWMEQMSAGKSDEGH